MGSTRALFWHREACDLSGRKKKEEVVSLRVEEVRLRSGWHLCLAALHSREGVLVQAVTLRFTHSSQDVTTIRDRQKLNSDRGRREIDGSKAVKTGSVGYWKRLGEAADEGFCTESEG